MQGRRRWDWESAGRGGWLGEQRPGDKGLVCDAEELGSDVVGIG